MFIYWWAGSEEGGCTDECKKRLECSQVDVEDGCYPVERDRCTGLVVGGPSSIKSVGVMRRDPSSDTVSRWPKTDVQASRRYDMLKRKADRTRGPAANERVDIYLHRCLSRLKIPSKSGNNSRDPGQRFA